MLCDTVAMYRPIYRITLSNAFTYMHPELYILYIYKINCRFCKIVLFFVSCYILRLAFLSIGPQWSNAMKYQNIFIYRCNVPLTIRPNWIDNEISKLLLFYTLPKYFEICYAHMNIIQRLCQNILAVYEYSLYAKFHLFG